jgi:hypothetical protein
MKGRVRLKEALFAMAAGTFLTVLPAWADTDPLLEFSRACRDVTKAMLENHPNPFKSKAEFQEALRRVTTTLEQLRQLERQGPSPLSPQERRTVQEQIDQCAGALAAAMPVSSAGRK